MGLYVALGLLFVLTTWYLWRSRPEEDLRSGLPPSLLPPDSQARSQPRSEPSQPATSAAAPRRNPVALEPSSAGADDVAAILARLAEEPSYRIDREQADCQRLIAAGVDSLRALYAHVVAYPESWVHLYSTTAVVADGLGEAGYEVIAELLRQSVEQHHSRLTSFVDYAAGDMDPRLCASLCSRVDADSASAFGEAAAHHDEPALRYIVTQLGTAAKDQAVALQRMLTAFFSSSSLTDRDLWLGALQHADPRVRAAAALAAGDRGSEPKLLALASDPDESVRHALLAGPDELPRELLLRLTRDPSPRVRATACWELEGGSEEVLQTYRRLLADPHPAVALMAAVGLDDVTESDDEASDNDAAAAGQAKASDGPSPVLRQRLLDALASPDPLLRELGAQVAGFLPAADYCRALRQLAQTGSPDELAAAIAGAEDEPEVQSCIAEILLQSPAQRVLVAGQIELAFSDCEAAVTAAARLLPVELPPRVRRAGFYAMAAQRAAWPTQLSPFLHPGEPLLADLLSELETALISNDPVDLPMFKRLRSRYPESPLAELADKALKRS